MLFFIFLLSLGIASSIINCTSISAQFIYDESPAVLSWCSQKFYQVLSLLWRETTQSMRRLIFQSSLASVINIPGWNCTHWRKSRLDIWCANGYLGLLFYCWAIGYLDILLFGYFGISIFCVCSVRKLGSSTSPNHQSMSMCINESANTAWHQSEKITFKLSFKFSLKWVFITWTSVKANTMCHFRWISSQRLEDAFTSRVSFAYRQ